MRLDGVDVVEATRALLVDVGLERSSLQLILERQVGQVALARNVES